MRGGMMEDFDVEIMGAERFDNGDIEMWGTTPKRCWIVGIEWESWDWEIHDVDYGPMVAGSASTIWEAAARAMYELLLLEP